MELIAFHSQLPSYGSANTKTFAALPGFSSEVSASAEFATSEVPVVTATYCFPPTANEIGYPLTGEPRFVSHRTLPVLSSKARKRPLSSPPKMRPPPVATNESVPARCSYFHAVRPVSTEIAKTVPTLSDARRELLNHLEAVHFGRIALIGCRRCGVANVLQAGNTSCSSADCTRLPASFCLRCCPGRQDGFD